MDELVRSAERKSSAAAQSPEANGFSLVIGASRGIGLALVTELLSRADTRWVVATCREASEASGLEALKAQHGDRLHMHRLDVSNDLSLAAFRNFVAAVPGGFDRVIHSAGILHEQRIQPEKSLEQCDPRALLRLFEVNSIGPLMVARCVLPQMHRKKKFVFAALSAMVGSISDNQLGGWYGYRASKTALNQFIRTLSIECRVRHPRAAVVAIHPGTTDTELSRPFQRNVAASKLYSRETTAQRILAVLDDADAASSGSFLNWDGARIPW